MTKENQLKHIEEKLNEMDYKIGNIDHLTLNEGGCKGTSHTYSRISGYYRNIENWNKGKQAEFNERLAYKTG
jgi:hypothetical protein